MNEEIKNKEQAEVQEVEEQVVIEQAEVQEVEKKEGADPFLDQSRDDVVKKVLEHKERGGMEKKKQQRCVFFNRALSYVLAILILFATFFLGYKLAPTIDGQDSAFPTWAVEQINEHAYLIDHQVTAGEIMKYGIANVMYQDPYVRIYTPYDIGELINSYTGSNKSIGMTIGQYEGTEGIYILDLIKGSTAEKSGLIIGARVMTINGTDYWAGTMDDINAQILAIPDETDIEVVVAPPVLVGSTLTYDQDNAITATVSRTSYIADVVRYFDNNSEGLENTLDSDTAIIQIYSFVGDTASQFEKAMAQYKENGKTNLILDLRNNGGGTEENLKAVASYLITDGENQEVEILMQKYKDGSERRMYTDDCKYDDYTFNNMIVLTNANTASASEALLLAMQDYGTVDKIIGLTTFGKGTGLITMIMDGNNPQYAITFTDSYFFSPLGNTNEKVGIKPTPGYGMEENINKNIPYKMYLDTVILRATNSLK